MTQVIRKRARAERGEQQSLLNSWGDIIEVERKKGLLGAISAVSPWKLPDVLFLSLISGRWEDVSLTAGVTDTAALKPDELLSLFALLILLSTAAIQIRAHGPLGSHGGGQPPRCNTSVCKSVYACLPTLQVILAKIGLGESFFPLVLLVLYEHQMSYKDGNMRKYYFT